MASAVSPDLSWLPSLHLLLALASGLFLGFALQRSGLPGWTAAAMAAAVFWWPGQMSMRPHVIAMLAECVAFSMSAIAVGFALLTVSCRSAGSFTIRVIGLSVFTFLAYQVRPAMVFLVLWAPLFWVLARALRGEVAWRAGAFRKRLAAVCAATVVPLVLFCLLRLVVVGHFGITSYGGWSLAGIAAGYLDDELIKELPVDLRDFAVAVHAKQKQRGKAVRGETLRHMSALERYSLVIKTYDDHFHRTCRPLALERCRGDPVAAHRLMNRLAVACIRRRPRLYAQWLATAWFVAFKRCFRLFPPLDWLMLGTVMGLVLVPVRLLFPGRSPADPRQGETVRQGAVVALLAVSFLLMNLALIVPIQMPLWRYLVVARMFYPAAAAFALAAVWRLVIMGHPVGEANPPAEEQRGPVDKSGPTL